MSGKFRLKKRFLLFMYGLYAIVAGLVILLSKLLGEPGLTGGLESLFETTFFLPAFFVWLWANAFYAHRQRRWKKLISESETIA